MYLVDAIRKDREMGARLLIEEFGVRLFATAYRLCLNDADAEDLTSRTFARAVELRGLPISTESLPSSRGCAQS